MFSAPPKKAFWMGTTRAPLFPGFSPRASSTCRLIDVASASRRRQRDPRLQAADHGDPARLGNLPEIVRGPERDAVFPGHELESRRHHADDRTRLAVHVEGRPDDVLCPAEAALPGLVGDDDGPRLLLLDDVVEVLRPVGAAQERRNPDDGQAADVHGHLRARGSSRPCRRASPGAPKNWAPPKASNEVPSFWRACTIS